MSMDDGLSNYYSSEAYLPPSLPYATVATLTLSGTNQRAAFIHISVCHCHCRLPAHTSVDMWGAPSSHRLIIVVVSDKGREAERQRPSCRPNGGGTTTWYDIRSP